MEIDLKIPDSLRSQPLEMGIDEAGRGPVLGPMVYGSAFAAVNYEWPDSVNDSKQLTAESRESTLACLQSLDVGFGTRVISAVEISANMLSPMPTNLNEMSHNAARALVQAALDAGLNVTKLFVDTVGPEAKYQAKLQGWFPSIRVKVSKKADSLFKCVGAASINAKVIRDRIVHNFEFEEGGMDLSHKFGSGYPSDPNTVKWLDQSFDAVFGFPSIARFSWGSITTIFEKKKAPADFETVTPDGRASVSSFFASRHLKAARID